MICTCGKDRATGEGAETGAEATEVMTPPVNEVNHVDLEGDDQGLEDIHIIEDTTPNPPIKFSKEEKSSNTLFKCASSKEKGIN